MSEELISKGLDKGGILIGLYEYFDTHRTNINSFKKHKVVPNRSYGKYGRREPDGLLVDRSDKNKPRVIVVIEHKSPKEFNTKKLRKKAIEQCNDICQVVSSKMGIITDSQSCIWINPNQANKENSYKDVTTGEKRSYSLILNEDKKELSEPFIIQTSSESDASKLDEETKDTLYYDREDS